MMFNQLAIWCFGHKITLWDHVSEVLVAHRRSWVQDPQSVFLTNNKNFWDIENKFHYLAFRVIENEYITSFGWFLEFLVVKSQTKYATHAHVCRLLSTPHLPACDIYFLRGIYFGCGISLSTIVVRLRQYFIIIIFVSSRNAFSCSCEGYNFDILMCYFIDVQCDEVLNSGRTITPIEFQV